MTGEPGAAVSEALQLVPLQRCDAGERGGRAADAARRVVRGRHRDYVLAKSW